MKTPKTIVWSIERLCGGGVDALSSQRIICDCNLVLTTVGVAFRNGGRMVPGLANRSVYHNHAEGINHEGWGEVWMKNLLFEKIGLWLYSITEGRNRANRRVDLEPHKLGRS